MYKIKKSKIFKEFKMQKTNNIKQIKVQQLPHGRGPSYAEDIKLVQSHYNRIKASKQYDEEQIRFILAGKFYKPVEIIDEYLCFGEYLNDSALDALAESKMGKRFFELMQRIKRILAKIHRHEEIVDDEITSKISKAVLQMLSEYNEKRKINTKDWQRFIGSYAEIQNKLNHSTLNKNKTKKPQVFNYWYGNKASQKYPAITINEVNKILKKVSRELESNKVSEDINLRRKADNIKKEILRLAEAHHQILELDRQKSSIEQLEAA